MPITVRTTRCASNTIVTEVLGVQIERIGSLTRDIATSVRTQADAVRDIAVRAEEIARQAESNSSFSIEAHAEAVSLADASRHLNAAVSHFRA